MGISLNLFEDNIIIKDEDGNERQVKALCASEATKPNLDNESVAMIKSVKVVYIDGHEIKVGVDGQFYHPDTRVLYTV